MKATFPKTVTVEGIPKLSATIYRNRQDKDIATKDGKVRTVRYVNYTLAYPLLGKLKRQTFADLDEAIAAGQEAIKRMANDEQRVLELTGSDRDEVVRARDILAPWGKGLDVAASVCAEMWTILNGKASPQEAGRYFMKAHAKELPRIEVSKAVEKCLTQARTDGKSKARMHQLEFYLNAFSTANNVEVSQLTPGLMSRYLTAMDASDRTKKNARDVLGYFGRWLVMQGYLERGTDLLENVQTYGTRSAVIHIFSPEEINRLIEAAEDRLLPYLVIGAFAGLRGAEIQRLDWSEVDLQDGFIEVKAEKAKTDTRRLVPIKPNLAAWLKDCAKKSGPVCPFKNVVNQLMKLVATINKKLSKDATEKQRMKWKKNALRHSYISYRVAECADVARVADESGNSPAIIKANYLKRVKPAQAAVWFGIMPAGAVEPGKVIPANV